MQKIIKEINLDDFNNRISYSEYGKYFTSNEIERFGKKPNKASLAARYLIKEVLVEWVGDALKPVDIEILNNEFGRPQICSIQISKDMLKKIHISVSHTKSKAVALIICDN